MTDKEIPKEEYQKYWDACLIKTWRNIGTLDDAERMFRSIVKKWPSECGVELLRHPNFFLPFKVQMQYYVATYLPKISEWLWSHTPDKDVEFLRAITKSKYSVQKKELTEDEKERANVRSKAKRERERFILNTTRWRDRNSATDWNVVKGPVRSKVRRK